MAADSSLSNEANQRVSVAECKIIRVVDSPLAVAFTGINGTLERRTEDGLTLSAWRVSEVFRKIASQRQSAQSIAEEWARFVHEATGDFLLHFREHFLNSVPSAPIHMAQAIVMSYENSVVVRYAEVFYRERTDKLVSQVRKIKDERPVGMAGARWIMPEIRKATPQGLAWSRELMALRPEKRVARAVELQATLSPEHVGGPIDVISVSKDGVKWIQRKPCCPDS